MRGGPTTPRALPGRAAGACRDPGQLGRPARTRWGPSLARDPTCPSAGQLQRSGASPAPPDRLRSTRSMPACCRPSACRRWCSTDTATGSCRSARSAVARGFPGARKVGFAGDDHLRARVDPDPMRTRSRGSSPDPPGPPARPCPRHGPVHRHRRLHPAGDRRSATAAGSSCSRAMTSGPPELERFRGREVKTLGDGFLATFDGPARAIRCASAIRDRCGRSILRSAPGCTPASSSCSATTSAACRPHRRAHRHARGRERGARLPTVKDLVAAPASSSRTAASTS